MKLRIVFAILFCAPVILIAEDDTIVNRNGQDTGYRVHSNAASSASPSEMIHLSEYLANNRRQNSFAGRASSVADSAVEGYELGNSLAMRRTDLKLKEIELKQAELDLQQRTAQTEGWDYAMAELNVRLENEMESRCADGPTDPALLCADKKYKAQIPGVVDLLIKEKQLVLVPRAWLKRESRTVNKKPISASKPTPTDEETKKWMEGYGPDPLASKQQ